MSLSIAYHESLPYIEPTPTASQSSAVAALIAAELPTDYTTTLHPTIPEFRASQFTPALTAELERVAKNEPMTGGVDLSRYETPAAPEDTRDAGAWESVLGAAYAASAHLGNRLTNLSLLSEFGKNAWLIHNAQLEDLLKGMEEELMAYKTQCEVVNKERKAAQRNVEDEMRKTEDRWKRGVGRVLEVELASEGLRRQILEKQREGK